MEKPVSSVFPPKKSWLGKIDWKRIATVVSLLWIIAQIVLIIVFWDVRQRSDQGSYIRTAIDFYNRGAWYPDHTSVYDSYIWAPGLINWFILQLHVFGTLKLNYIFNLLMNIGILYNVWFLSYKFFSRRTAYVTVVLFCLLYSNTMVVLPAGTEVPFLFLSLTAFSLCVSGRTEFLLVAGCLLAVSNWIRPLAIIYIPAILLMMYLHKRRLVHYVALLVPVVAMSLLFGLMAQKQCGYFVFQSTTSGVNLIMTANDKAYGGVATSLHSDTTNICYIKNSDELTFVQKDSIWKVRAIDWIKDHPARFAGLYVLKLGGLYIEDSWPERPIIGGDGFVDKMAHGKADKVSMIKRTFNMLCKSVVYYMVCILFLIALVRQWQDIRSEKGVILVVLLLGTLSTCLFSVSPRYHYPFLFVIIIWAAYGVDRLIAKGGERS